jgi:hypothetical protein
MRVVRRILDRGGRVRIETGERTIEYVRVPRYVEVSGPYMEYAGYDEWTAYEVIGERVYRFDDLGLFHASLSAFAVAHDLLRMAREGVLSGPILTARYPAWQ